MHLLSSQLGKLVLSLILLGALFPIVIRFFRSTWKTLDAQAEEERRTFRPGDLSAWRAPATFILGAFSLLMLNYFGTHEFFSEEIYPWLCRFGDAHPGVLHLDYFENLYWRVYWGLSRYAAYLFPIVVWPWVFKESPWDLGLRFRGLREHAWIYVLCIVIIIPVLFVISFAPEFQAYYPMYPLAGRSWVDLIAWEVIYLGQFLTLEIFFRGFFLRGARSLGASAIFAMCVPYVMIHFPKPYLEAAGALVAGIVLGSLSMQTGSIWAGFLVHSTVAVLMDVLSLQRRGTLPDRLTPTSSPTSSFQHTAWLLWGLWIVAIMVLAWLLVQRRRPTQDIAPRAPIKRTKH